MALIDTNLSFLDQMNLSINNITLLQCSIGADARKALAAGAAKGNEGAARARAQKEQPWR
jgi:hypothetical protein